MALAQKEAVIRLKESINAKNRRNREDNKILTISTPIISKEYSEKIVLPMIQFGFTLSFNTESYIIFRGVDPRDFLN